MNRDARSGKLASKQQKALFEMMRTGAFSRPNAEPRLRIRRSDQDQ
jgi:hypothetical protein